MQIVLSNLKFGQRRCEFRIKYLKANSYFLMKILEKIKSKYIKSYWTGIILVWGLGANTFSNIMNIKA